MKKIFLMILLLSFSGNLFAMGEEENKKSYWPHFKIIVGVGFTGLSIYCALTDNKKPFSIASKLAETIGHTVDNSAQLLLSPTIFIANGSALSWAPLIPAYFFLKSGFDDLRLEKESQIKKLFKKEKQKLAAQIRSELLLQNLKGEQYDSTYNKNPFASTSLKN
jgi:hypothetical protein